MGGGGGIARTFFTKFYIQKVFHSLFVAPSQITLGRESKWPLALSALTLTGLTSGRRGPVEQRHLLPLIGFRKLEECRLPQPIFLCIYPSPTEISCPSLLSPQIPHFQKLCFVGFRRNFSNGIFDIHQSLSVKGFSRSPHSFLILFLLDIQNCGTKEEGKNFMKYNKGYTFQVSRIIEFDFNVKFLVLMSKLVHKQEDHKNEHDKYDNMGIVFKFCGSLNPILTLIWIFVSKHFITKHGKMKNVMKYDMGIIS